MSKIQDYLKQQTGPNPAPVAGPTRPGAKMRAYVTGRMAGQPMTDPLTAGDTTDAPTTGDAQSIEDEARSRLDADVLAGVDEGNPWAIRLLKATIKLVEIERARPEGV
jgi:hypothetical protein